ncbi:MAG: hypothetical protein EHM12_13335 [Dehalococcoidia bacterium]|nr:MAG: hypothetical protein EHM12_13335 [Dehalococcoidia bacterium]
MSMRAFSPSNSTKNIVVSAASQRVNVVNRNSPVTVRIVNNGIATVWLNFGDATVTASLSTSLPIGPGVHEVLTLSPGQDGNLYIAAIAAAATGTIYFTPGEGL